MILFVYQGHINCLEAWQNKGVNCKLKVKLKLMLDTDSMLLDHDIYVNVFV